MFIFMIESGFFMFELILLWILRDVFIFGMDEFIERGN